MSRATDHGDADRNVPLPQTSGLVGKLRAKSVVDGRKIGEVVIRGVTHKIRLPLRPIC